MDIEQIWKKALKETEIYRQRLDFLPTFEGVDLSYILLSKSEFSPQDTVVRKGSVYVSRPMILMPPDYPIFEGFDFKEVTGLSQDSIQSFLYMRGIRLPSLKYYNKTYTMDIMEVPLEDVLKDIGNKLERMEDIHTGLIVGPNDIWQFSLLIYVANIVARSIGNDIRKMMDDNK